MSRQADARGQALARLRELAALGEDGLPRAREGASGLGRAEAVAAPPDAPLAGAVTDAPVAGATTDAPLAGATTDAPVAGATTEAPLAGATDLERLRTELVDCQRCKLCAGRTQVVFGTGSPTARLMFVGEGPGRDEDLQGEPFVGRAGQLLTDMIERGMGLRRADVYIANVVKCRPPENRNPEPDEVEACSPFLRRQVELVGPAVLVALGKFAAQTLLRTDTPISRLRGRWHDYAGIPLMPTFHPAYLLRNPAEKRAAWEDLKQVMDRLGLQRPKTAPEG